MSIEGYYSHTARQEGIDNPPRRPVTTEAQMARAIRSALPALRAGVQVEHSGQCRCLGQAEHEPASVAACVFHPGA